MEKMEKIVSLLSVIVASLALIFSYYAYKQISKQQVQSKQIDAVTELVEYIHNSTIQLTINVKNENTRSIIRQNLTLFEISNYGDVEYGSVKLDSMKIYLKEGEKFPIFFNSYVTNPLIPKEIADILKNFYSYGISISTAENLNKESHIIFSNLIFLEEQAQTNNIEEEEDNKSERVQLYSTLKNVPAYINFGELKKYSKLLQKEIMEWYKKQGVDNINIRNEDYLNSFL